MVKKVSKNLLFSLVLLVSFFTLHEPAFANTIVDKSQVYLYPGEFVKTTRTLYLQPGSWLGIYVNENNVDPAFQWVVYDTNGDILTWGNGDENKIIGAPVGYYYLMLYSPASSGSANGILSVQLK